MRGTLYIVATPIGNMNDITIRALEVLKGVDIIACEDTRRTIKLLNHFEFKKKLMSYHEHNKIGASSKIINYLLEGKNVALVSDAGTPAISDPGEDLIKHAVNNNITVTTLPGPAAVISALLLSALDMSKFSFIGFLPQNKKEKSIIINEIKNSIFTIILYESPHRIKKTLAELYSILGERCISISREITKKYEETLRVTLSEAIIYFESNEPKGEYIIVLEGNKIDNAVKEYTDEEIIDRIKLELELGLTTNDLSKKISKETGIKKRYIYELSNKL